MTLVSDAGQIRFGEVASISSVVAVAASRAWFRDLPRDFQRDLLQQSDQHDLRRGTIVWKPGDAPDGIHCILSGEVEFYDFGANNRRGVYFINRAGHWIGVLTAIGGLARVRHARAAHDLKLLSLPQAKLDAMLNAHPDRYRHLMKVVSIEFERSAEIVRDLTTRTGQERLVRLLLRLSKGGDRDSSQDRPRIEISQDILATMSGLTRQRVNRILKDLEGVGAVSISYASVKITDRPRLAEIGEGMAPAGNNGAAQG